MTKAMWPERKEKRGKGRIKKSEKLTVASLEIVEKLVSGLVFRNEEWFSKAAQPVFFDGLTQRFRLGGVGEDKLKWRRVIDWVRNPFWRVGAPPVGPRGRSAEGPRNLARVGRPR